MRARRQRRISGARINEPISWHNFWDLWAKPLDLARSYGLQQTLSFLVHRETASSCVSADFWPQRFQAKHLDNECSLENRGGFEKEHRQTDEHWAVRCNIHSAECNPNRGWQAFLETYTRRSERKRGRPHRSRQTEAPQRVSCQKQAAALA